ncbi:hypothetical protein L7F22_054158 [Adiantum nelumboides]|nr:hypothetical protein [Adiantum nelumboides]
MVQDLCQGLRPYRSTLDMSFEKKGMRIDWKAEHEASFSELKGYLVSSPILKLSDFSKEFEVVTDASGLALGGVLTQEERPVVYTSRKLRDHERNYPTHDFELLAVIHALKLWRHYLLSHKFQLVTDHKSLKWIFTQPNLNMRQRRWIELLQEYDFDIKYRPGKDNVVADGLSCKSFLNAISIPNNPILDMIKQASLNDLEHQDLACRIQDSGETKEISRPAKEYSLRGDSLYYEQRLCIPKDPTLKKDNLFEAHDSPISGHPASDISRVFIKEIFRLHGLPKRIVSDSDAKFTSKFWASLFQAIGTHLCFSTAYHPQTGGQTEMVNQVIEDILRAYCSQQPKKWVQYFSLVEYAYNSFDHRSIGMSPFKALYGQECIAPLNFSDPTIKLEASKQMLDEMEAQTKAILKDIQAAQDRQNHYADKDRSKRTFKLGERVFLRVKSKRSNLSLGKFKKLSPRYCAPYEIVKVISDQAYKLRLPPNLKVHDVFHVSLLKPYVPNPDQILDVEQIVVPAQGVLEFQLDYILEMRERKLMNRSIIKHLVK